MKQILLKPLENHITNLDYFLKELILCLKENKKFEIFINEGVDLSLIKIKDITFLDFLKDLCRDLNFPKEHINIVTYNLIQDKKVWPTVSVTNRFLPMIIEHSKKYLLDSVEKNIEKTFGFFVGGSRWHRLWLGSYLYKNYHDQTILTYWQHHFNKTQPCNLHIDDLLMKLHSSEDKTVYDNLFEFCNDLPLHLEAQHEDKNKNTGYINWDDAFDELKQSYSSIFVDIVGETWHEGQCFFPTEKTIRPMVFETPFIVYASKNYLKNLKLMGFKTFHEFWDESYDNYEGVKRLEKISTVIQTIGQYNRDQLKSIYKKISVITSHNKNILNSLSKKQIDRLYI